MQFAAYKYLGPEANEGNATLAKICGDIHQPELC